MLYISEDILLRDCTFYVLVIFGARTKLNRVKKKISATWVSDLFWATDKLLANAN